MDTSSTERNDPTGLAATGGAAGPRSVGKPSGSPLEVLLVYLKLGVSSFGGPIAHIGYFREEFVVRRRWLDEQAFVDLVALCQFLPGPASSQVGFSIGLDARRLCRRLAAWTGFTLPSAIVLVLFAYGAGALTGPLGTGLLHGLKLVAVAIVAQAVSGMARTLCPDRQRASIAVVAALIILFSGSSHRPDRQHPAWRPCRPVALSRRAVVGSTVTLPCRSRARAGLAALTAFFVLLVGLPILQSLHTLAGPRGFRRLLSFGRAGVRRRPCRAAAVARSVRAAGLGERRCVPRRLWRGAGSAGTALHLRRLSWRRGQCDTARRRRRRARAVRHFHSRHSDPAWHAAVLGRAFANAPARRRRCAASTPRWSVSLAPRSTIRSGRARSKRREISELRSLASCSSPSGALPPLLVVIVGALGGLALTFVR